MCGMTYTAAIIGTGRIGFSLGLDKKREQPASHTAALRNNRRVRLVAGCDTDPERLEAWGKSNRTCRLYSVASDLFESELSVAGRVPDIVSVAVNEAAHHNVALEAIRSRPRLVILEKPVALNTAQAVQIKEAAAKHGVPVMINHERRFSRDYKLARALIPAIGDLQSVTASLHSTLRVWSAAEEESGFYSLLHDGTHLVDVVLFLLGGVCAEPALVLEKPLASGYFFDKDKALRNLSVSFSCPVCPSVVFNFSGRSSFFGFELDILGTKGRIRIGNGFMELYESAESSLYSGFRSLERRGGLYSFGGEAKPERALLLNGRFVGKTGYFSGMVQNAVDFLDGKARLGSTVDDGIAVLRVLEQMKSLVRSKAEELI